MEESPRSFVRKDSSLRFAKVPTHLVLSGTGRDHENLKLDTPKHGLKWNAQNTGLSAPP